jgi:hypothetical protein
VSLGRKCPHCKLSMYAKDEVNTPKGRWLTYECRSAKCMGFRENVFEEYADRQR